MMIGGRFLKTSSKLAVTAAAGIFMSGYALSSAQAVGFDGDLEERVAELEATTVRKGNRKVSLKLSGQVNRSLLWWDDGYEDNVYSVDNSNTSTRFRLTGKVGVLPGISAGYKMEFDVETARSGSVDQINDDRGARYDDAGGDGDLQVRVGEWYIEIDPIGKLTVGQGSPATDDLVKINLGGTAVATKDGLIMDTGGGFFLRESGVPGVGGLSAATWGALAPGLDTARMDRVRYDSPTIAGFTLSAAWGEDDFWDVALRFAQEIGGIRIAGGIGYSEDHDEEADGAGFGLNTDVSNYKGSISAWAPGLLGVGPYVSASFVHREFDGDANVISNIFSPNNGRALRDFDFWRVEGGVRHNFTGLGDTTIYAEYAEADDGLDSGTGGGIFCNTPCGGLNFLEETTNSSVEMFGLGIVQRINPAAMELFISYRNYEATVNGINSVGGAINLNLEDLQLVHAGGRIKF